MPQLLIHDPTVPAAPTSETYFGGRPSLIAGLQWPVCSSCHGNMQFLGQLQERANHHIAVFMCQNDPGMCDEWDANAGGNLAVQVDGALLELVDVPTSGNVLRDETYGASLVDYDGDTYDQARDTWLAQSGGRARMILGSFGGDPQWLQADETPSCNICSKPMAFVAQLEEGPDHRTAMNFGGGGCGYVFKCDCDRFSAKFLWQS